MDHWKHTINNDHQIALELWHKSRARLTRRVPTCAFVCAARMRLPPAPRPRVPPCAGVGSAPIVSRLARKGQLEKERNAAFNTAILKENGSILFEIRHGVKLNFAEFPWFSVAVSINGWGGEFRGC